MRSNDRFGFICLVGTLCRVNRSYDAINKKGYGIFDFRSLLFFLIRLSQTLHRDNV